MRLSINKKSFKLLYFSLLTVVFSSCITSKNINYLQEPKGSVPSYDAGIGYQEYVLAPYDKVFISVYSPDKNINTLFNGNMNQMSMMMSGTSDQSDLYTYTITEEGTISLPMIGDVKISGLYVRDAQKLIQESIQSVMIDECAVNLRTVGRYFSVIGGKVNGKYPILREKMNIFQAVAMAGDLAMTSDRQVIKVLRETPSGHQIKVFDIRSKDIINSEFYYIQPNDVIYVQEVRTQFFSVTNVGNVFSTFFSTVSFGMLIYNLTKPVANKPSGDDNNLEIID